MSERQSQSVNFVKNRFFTNYLKYARMQFYSPTIVGNQIQIPILRVYEQYRIIPILGMYYLFGKISM